MPGENNVVESNDGIKTKRPHRKIILIEDFIDFCESIQSDQDATKNKIPPFIIRKKIMDYNEILKKGV